MTQTVDARDLRNLRNLRMAAGGMLAAAVAWPLAPVHPPLVCPLRATTGIPCPLCGMTRAIVAAMHGDIIGSLRYNPAGVIVVLAAFVLLVAGRRLTPARPPGRLLPVGLAALGALWAYNIGWNPTFT